MCRKYRVHKTSVRTVLEQWSVEQWGTHSLICPITATFTNLQVNLFEVWFMSTCGQPSTNTIKCVSRQSSMVAKSTCGILRLPTILAFIRHGFHDRAIGK